MARSRNIKPGLFKNEILGIADPIYTIVFCGLWTLADREGIIEYRPMRIKAEIIPYREKVDIGKIIDWLVSKNFVIKYECDGNEYIQVVNFTKHQNPHKNEPQSNFPKYNHMDEAVPINSGVVPINSEALGLIPDSLNLIPDYSNTEGEKNSRATKIKTDFAISEDMRTWAKENNLLVDLDSETQHFIDYFTANGKPMKDWIAAWRNWIRNAVKFHGSKNKHGPIEKQDCTICDYMARGRCEGNKTECKSFIRKTA